MTDLCVSVQSRSCAGDGGSGSQVQGRAHPVVKIVNGVGKRFMNKNANLTRDTKFKTAAVVKFAGQRGA